MKLKTTILSFALVFCGNLMSQTVSHFAGKVNETNANTKYNNSTCAFADVYFYKPEGITWDNKDNMWITEKNKIRLLYNNQFYNRGGAIGDGDQSSGYANGTTGASCLFSEPSSIVSDASGNLFVVDLGNHAIRKIVAFTSTGQSQEITTFAGADAPNPLPGSTTDVSGKAARFYYPQAIARDANGNFYLTDLYNSTIRKITSAGFVSTLAGTPGTAGSKDGKTGVATFESPFGIAFLDADNLVISDQSAGTIRKITLSTFMVSTICGKAGFNETVDGTLANASFKSPKGIAVVDGRIFVCDGSVIRVIDIAKNKVSTYAGSSTEGNKDGIGTAAQFGNLVGMAYNAKTKLLYVTDHTYNIIKTVTIVTIGISKVSNNFSFNVAPNPSGGLFTIENSDKNLPIQSLELADITGKVLFIKTCHNSLSETFDLSNFQNGFYFVKVNTSKGSSILKLQKN
ncbi:MAG: T9SS type A sorting domain-containing protein [Bacteroidia bacterium]